VDEYTIDGLASRVQQLEGSEIAATGPLLALVSELLEDARRQYDRTAAAVLIAVRARLVEALEAGVERDRWISVRQAAGIARRPEGTIRYWCRERLVVARKVGARDWEIDRDSLLKRAAA
jgi:hypothetical protein